MARKLPMPGNPEAGFGAVAEDGSHVIMNNTFIREEKIDSIMKQQVKEARRRVDVLRRGEPFPAIAGRTVILVDDGLAMGSTMRVAVAMCRNRKAGKIVVAVPVSGQDTARTMERLADEFFAVETPPDFRAVAQVYENWYDVSDEEVMELLNQ